jgi:signal transduction histidine kinase
MVQYSEGIVKEKQYRDHTRLVILTFFLSSGGVLFIRRLLWSLSPHRPPFLTAFSLPAMFLVVLGFFFWYLVELYDFFRWNYEIEKTSLRRRLFVLRVFPFLLVTVVIPEAYSLLFPMFIVVLAFYSCIDFDTRIAVPVLLLLLLLQIGNELFFIDPARPQGDQNRQVDFFFLIYKIMNSLLVWLIAFFWKRDRLRWRENRELTDDLRRTKQQLRQYAEQVADTVVLEERTRLARDIHDSIGHTLTAAAIQLTKAEGYFSRDADTALHAIVEARGCIQEGMRDIREVLGTLNSRAGDFDLLDQVRRLADSLPGDRFKVDLRLSGDQRAYNKAVLLAVYRMVQEGITNILKHSDANRVEIQVNLGKNRVKASVRDNGRGFTLTGDNEGGNHLEAGGLGFGLEGLRDRISLVRGTMKIESPPGGGTSLQADIPREPAALIDFDDRSQSEDSSAEGVRND